MCHKFKDNSRIFVSRLISEIKKLKKNHHKIRLSTDVKLDLSWWKYFLKEFAGVSLITDGVWSSPDEVSAGNAHPLAGGSYVEDEYWSREFPAVIMDEPIHIKEMHVVVTSAKLWGPRWSRKQIVIYCDNDASCDAITYQKPKDPKLQMLVRTLLFLQCKYSFSIKAEKISSSDNRIADFLSRCQNHSKIDKFFIENGIPLKQCIKVKDSDFIIKDLW